MTHEKYFDQAKLLLRVLPHIAKEGCFALKGGTAINLFVRDMPRLSIDIDLAYLPIEERIDSLENIGQALDRITREIGSIGKVTAQKATEANESTEMITFTSKLLIQSKEGIIKIEPNTVFRGNVFHAEKRHLVKVAQDKLTSSTTISTLSAADLYGSKLCAALDRQHPRDLFDVMILLKHEGINEKIRKAFIVYLAAHSRPMHELLDPHFKDIRHEYKSNFLGMAEIDVSCEDLIQCQKKLPGMIKNQFSKDEKEFLISLGKGQPEWHLLGLHEIERLPALQWKLQNIEKMQPMQRITQLRKLTTILE